MQKRVKVCVRVRPTTSKDFDTTNSNETIAISEAVVIDEQQQTVNMFTLGGGTSFRFDQVLSPGIDQAGVFRLVGSDVVDGALNGYNGCVLAYGQTGAGKTFTMSGGGPRRRFEDRGLIARSLSRVFQRTQQDADHSYALRMSYLEIYNDRLIDLLAPGIGNHGTSQASNDLTILQNARGQTFVRGLTKSLVSSEEQALDLVFQGETNRAVAEHALNDASTRSHCIFTLYLERKRSAMSSELMEEDGMREIIEDDVVYSKLHLVDLAGSERMKKTLTEAGSTRANEACYINRSLSFLEQVVLALGSKNRAHVPFRQSPLTNLLKDSLGGNCHTFLVACVWPAPAHADQSLATLRFAARMRRVKTQAIINVATCGAGYKLANEERAAYRDEIRRLREELVLYDAIAGQTRAGHSSKGNSYHAEELRRQQITEFLTDAEQVPPVQSARQVHQLLQSFRSVCLEQKASVESSINLARKTESKMVTQIRALRGHTPPDLSPSSELSKSANNINRTEPTATILPPLHRGNQMPWSEQQELEHWQQQQREASAPTLDESDKELFERFKSMGGANPGAEALRDLEQAKTNLREARAQFATLVLAVNRVKMEIDGYTLELHKLRDRPTPDQQKEVEATEGKIMPLLQVQDAKKRYRTTFEQLQEKKAEVWKDQHERDLETLVAVGWPG